ncbi:Uma2 family endonuclease [uncultured Hymenobacter sp.]|uniref:Uma2 family endonuclease n=1 Tax=uncultured Hymenobacter sp. TaxID=170016 RepID=UPI0035CB6D7D
MPPITSFSQLDVSKTYSYADYLTWQFDELVELIKGKVRRMSPAPRRVHQEISGYFFGSVYAHLLSQPCKVYHAPFDVRLTTAGPNGDAQITTVVQPDICVVCDPTKLDDKGCLGSPDWIIEILSPSTAAYDTKEKFDLYEESGVTEYWIVFPGEKSIAAYVLENGRYQARGTYFAPGDMPVHTLPGLQLQWERVFEEA